MDEDQASELEALDGLLSNPSAEPIKLSYGLLKFITGNFSNEIGRGGFGVVYKGTLQNGEVAVKKISNVHELSDKLFMDEITCLMRAKHKNIVRFLGYCSENQGEVMEYQGAYVMAEVQKRLLCFEYVPNGNIRDYLEEQLDESEWRIRYRIIKGICEGLHYLHAERISHLDLKPENVMLDACMEAKITDFGLARCLVEGQSKVYTKIIRGTPGYIAPENINTGEISLKSDIYALGIIIIKLITRRNIIDFDNWHELSDVDNLQVKGCIEIARACIEVDKDERPTVAEIIHELDGMENIIQDWTDVTSSSTDQILETHNNAEEKKRMYLPYNILPLNPGSPNQASVRHPEIQSAFRVLQDTRGLPWPKHHQWNADADLLEWLQAMFGFQKDNVSNQREYLVLLLANVHTSKPKQEPMLDANALDNVMNKLFANYKKWCKYLGQKSSLWMPTIQQEVQQRKLLYMGLYLLIWGEAITLRFIPECLFYMYHHMAFELYGMLAGNVSAVTGEYVKPAYGGEEEAFLKKVVTPINKILEEIVTPHIKILQEAEESKTNKSKQSHWRNYDDLSAYFWSRDCFRLGWPMRSDADFFDAPDLALAPRDQMNRVIRACTRWLRTWSIPKRS